MLDKINKDELMFLVPPLVGALLGLRYAQNQTVGSRLVSYIISVVMGVYVGAGAGEYLALGHWATGGVMFSVAAIGMEAVAYVFAALREGVADPVKTARRWIAAVLGRSE